MNPYVNFDLPAIIYTPHRPDGFRRINECVWDDLRRSMDMRDEVAAAMIAEDVRFGIALETLRPIMRGHPEMTVAEAFAVLEGRE
jgi:hypothetical protein